jgi:hypothetical protein
VGSGVIGDRIDGGGWDLCVDGSGDIGGASWGVFFIFDRWVGGIDVGVFVWEVGDEISGGRGDYGLF